MVVSLCCSSVDGLSPWHDDRIPSQVMIKHAEILTISNSSINLIVFFLMAISTMKLFQLCGLFAYKLFLKVEDEKPA